MNTHFTKTNTPIKLYRNPKSGHCHRVELMLALLDIPYTTIDLDMANGEHKSASYLKLNPFGQVPAIDDNGITLFDSNAIITYLAKKYHNEYEWLPQDPVQAAEVQKWLSVAAGEIAAGPCAVRLVKVFGVDLDYKLAYTKTENLFTVVEPLLKNNSYLTGNNITLADIAAYSYIAHVPEGGFSLAPYPAIRAWLGRIEAQSGFIGMQQSALPE